MELCDYHLTVPGACPSCELAQVRQERDLWRERATAIINAALTVDDAIKEDARMLKRVP